LTVCRRALGQDRLGKIQQLVSDSRVIVRVLVERGAEVN
jgi:hypothetical protein